jgi:hypothetical protein
VTGSSVTASIGEITPALIDDKSHNLNAWKVITVPQIIRNFRRRTRFVDVYIND